MNAGGTLLSLFGIITGFAYLARSFHVLYNVPRFEKDLEEDDALNNDDDNIWYVEKFLIRTKCSSDKNHKKADLMLSILGCSTFPRCSLASSS